MKKRLHILRQESGKAPYWEDFIFETGDESATVATALSSVSEKDLAEPLSGMPFRAIVWDHSCLQKRCGACAMVINGVPALACDSRLSELKGDMVTIEPLKKFPVIEDLMVDRQVMMETLKKLSVWFDQDAEDGGENTAFEASRCLQCGLCLEVCPNFAPYVKFAGMSAMTPMARLAAKMPKNQRKSFSADYVKYVYEGCGKSLACTNICPAKIDIEQLMVKSNAAAVWGRWNKKTD